MFLRATIATLMSLCLAAPAHAESVVRGTAYMPIEEADHDAAREEARTMGEFCGIPRPARGQRVVLVGAYDGEGMSTVALGGQDVETTVTYVDIEPGPEPLFVVLISYSSMVWVFRGATQRVAHAALMTRSVNNRPPAVGAVGLRRERVSIHPACYQYFRSVNDRQAHVASEALARTIGRPVDHLVGVDYASAIALPSGALTETRWNRNASAPRGYNEQLWREALRFTPAGLIEINPESVVGARAEPYRVYPNQFGIAQLVRSGHLAYEGGESFRMLRALPRYPAELNGAHSVVFIRPGNIPEPQGSPGHSCVVNEGADEAVGPACRTRLGRRDRRAP
jgi:hypothetical protein